MHKFTKVFHNEINMKKNSNFVQFKLPGGSGKHLRISLVANRAVVVHMIIPSSSGNGEYMMSLASFRDGRWQLRDRALTMSTPEMVLRELRLTRFAWITLAHYHDIINQFINKIQLK